jgi:NADPH-dependent glutamate synthase beta subunit-like oxidoreductase/NAD-dependent dihydropyrimidine dehydrogenase PreA subunit
LILKRIILKVNVCDSKGGLTNMMKGVDKAASRVEEVVDAASGKAYLPPCQVRCPLKIDIQRNHVMISCLPLDEKEASSQILKIGDEVYDKNPLFPIICGYICGLCEKECNYEDQTGAVRRKLLLRFIAEHYLPYLETKPSYAAPTREKVAVIGGGPASLMCAYTLSRQGYRVTIMDRNAELGGALRLIPRYRLPENILDATLNNLVRIAHVDVKLGLTIGNGEKALDELRNEGYQAVFIATGTPFPRRLRFERELVAGKDLEGVMFGLNLLSDVSQKKVRPRLFERKRVIVIGGGNVAFDAARTARRLGGKVTLVCLENEDKSSKDGIPADVEEIEGATGEGIEIVYSRGVEEIIGEDGKFRKIKCPRCTSVYDQMGYRGFNPKFDRSDVIYLEGDVLLVTIGQTWPRKPFRQAGLLDERDRLDVDPLTLMSNRRKGIFIGGDVRRIGYASEAMREGIIAAESIDRYLKGEDLMKGREKEKEYENAAIPRAEEYKPQPELKWLPAKKRINFKPFEKGFTLEKAVEEAGRCLCCGPCKSCKACVMLELQLEIPEIKINQEICSGCGVCVLLCSYDAIKLEKSGDGAVAVINDLRCKRCGVCAAACPSAAIAPEGFTNEEIIAEIEGVLV